jgi:ubiquitin carboxyl-terminal hydrolase 47
VTDFVRCKACGNESKREDTFLDVSLTVRSTIEKIYNDSVERALENYLKSEELSGSNQYECEPCQAKCDAAKGIKFTKFPYILMFQLKRFDLDIVTM